MKKERFWVLECMEAHEGGKKCDGLMIKTNGREEWLAIYPSEILAALAAASIVPEENDGERPKPRLVELTPIDPS